MVGLNEKITEYSKFLDGVLKREEDKIKNNVKCNCGCGSSTCTCTLDAYKNVVKKFYNIFPEYEKEFIR